MSPRHLAERRALYAAIDTSGDNHVRPRVLDPFCHHSTRSTCALVGEILIERDHRGQHWTMTPAGLEDGTVRHAVIDGFGDLVEVRP